MRQSCRNKQKQLDGILLDLDVAKKDPPERYYLAFTMNGMNSSSQTDTAETRLDCISIYIYPQCSRMDKNFFFLRVRWVVFFRLSLSTVKC